MLSEIGPSLLQGNCMLVGWMYTPNYTESPSSHSENSTIQCGKQSQSKARDLPADPTNNFLCQQLIEPSSAVLAAKGALFHLF